MTRVDEQPARAATWGISDSFAAPPGHPMVLTPADYLPPGLTAAQMLYEEMPRVEVGCKIPFARGYGLLIGYDRIRICTVGEAVSSTDQLRHLDTVTDLTWVAAPDRRWYEQVLDVGSVLLGAYRDIFLAAHLERHPDEPSETNARLLQECRFAVVSVFIPSDVHAGA